MKKLHLFYLLAILLVTTGCESEMSQIMYPANDAAMLSIPGSTNLDGITVRSSDYYIKFVPQSNGMRYQKLTISQAAPFNLTVKGEFRNTNGSELIEIWNIEHGQTETPFYSVFDENYLPLTEERWIVTVTDPNGGKQLAKLDTGSILAAADGRTWPFSSEIIYFTMNNSEFTISFAN